MANKFTNKITGGLKDKKSNIAFAKNSYSAMTGVIVIVIVIIANLIIQELAGTSLDIDISGSGIYDITETTTDLLADLDTEIEFTVIAQDGSIDPMVETFIEKYIALSSDLSITYIDSVLNPSALTTYNTTDYTIVVSCEETGKSTTIEISDIYYYDEYYYYYYGTYAYVFDGEGLFTSAIAQVTSEEEYVIYTVTGHGEESLNTTVSELIGKNSVSTSELNLLTTEEIPEDCDLLAIIGPVSDITEGEAELLSSYLNAGGDVLIMLGDTLEDMTNFNTLFNEYGIELVDGYIADLERAYQGNGYYIIPSLSVSGDMANDIVSESVLVVNTRGFVDTEVARDTIDVDAFMSTSTSGLAITEESEESGTYYLGVVATEDVTIDEETGETTEARLTVYGTSYLIAEGITSSFSSLENNTLFMNSVMANFEGSVNISIESISLEDTYNAVANANGYAFIFLIALPISALILGFVVWNTRRKK